MTMPQPSEPPHNSRVPLCVDLDGTLIKTDLVWESIGRLLRRNPFRLLSILFWWMRGRAFLKQQLAKRIFIDPATLPYNEPFLTFLREQKEAGRKLILATAFDQKGAMLVASYLGLFDEVLASDGKTNLRGRNKLKALVERFGERGFDYAGNASADLAVWRGAREAIVVNASHRVANRAAKCAKPGPAFSVGCPGFVTLKRFLNELFLRSGYLAAMGAGLLLTAAFPKIGVAGFAWIVPGLLLAIGQGKSRGDAFRIGYVAGLAYFLSSLYWLLYMPVTGFPILGWLSLGAYLALYPAVWVWLMSGFESRTPINREQVSYYESWGRRALWSLAGAAAWVALEMARARLLGGFPWNFLGVSQYRLVPLIQIASVTGVYGVSFVVVWFSISLFSAVRAIFGNPVRRFAWQVEMILPLAAVVGLFVFGYVRAGQEASAGTTLRMTLVQPSIPQTLIWDPAQDEKRFQQLLQLTEKALALPARTGKTPVLQSRTDLLIWPESAVPDLDEDTFHAISRLARSNHVWIIFNGDDVVFHPDATNYFNSAFLVTPDGRLADVYHKRKLVIFGEYIPLVHWLPFIKYFTPITGSFTPGDKPVVFSLDGWGETPGSRGRSPHQSVKAAPLICFEDTFPEVARASAKGNVDFLVNLTNDGWFGDSAAQWQHMANAVFRAVENNLPLIRCANNGVTCWIDARGRVRRIFKDKTGSVYGAGAMTVDVPMSLADEQRAPTFYNRHGDWFGWTCVAAAVLVLFLPKKRLKSSQKHRI